MKKPGPKGSSSNLDSVPPTSRRSGSKTPALPSAQLFVPSWQAQAAGWGPGRRRRRRRPTKTLELQGSQNQSMGIYIYIYVCMDGCMYACMHVWMYMLETHT